MTLRVVYRTFVMFLLAFTVAAHGAAEQTMAPDKLVEGVTQSLLKDIASYRAALDGAGDGAAKDALLRQFYTQLTNTLEPVIDFNWISLNVMGQYRKQATTEQREQFRAVFTRSLVETYGAGLLSYSDQKIVVHPLGEELAGQRKVTVTQEIVGVDKSYPLLYSMGLTRDGSWKVINVIINGINLGSTFRNQFVQAAAKYNGDLDQVIRNWAATES